MDVACPVCGEPWEHDSLHEVAQMRYGIPYYLNDSDEVWLKHARKRNPSWNSDDYQAVFRTVSAEFRTKGCNALVLAFGKQSHCVPVHNLRTAAAGALYELLGDDMDGAAAMLEDAGL